MIHKIFNPNDSQFAVVSIVTIFDLSILLLNMAKTNKKPKEQRLSKDYLEIMKGLSKTSIPLKEPQWSNSGDYFVKFSLYKDIPSVASTSTSILQS